MNTKGLTKALTSFKNSIAKHSPEILTGIGVAGLVTTTVMGIKATPKALYLLEERKDELETDDLPVIEVVKTAWKPYVPTIVTGAFSIACIIGASSVNAKRNAALATAYKLSEEAFSTYKAKVIETIGEKKELAVREKVDKERIDRNPVSSSEVVITGRGESLCYDVISGRYFNCDLQKIREVKNDLNELMIGGDSYVSLSQFYDGVNLPHTEISDYIGWNLYKDGKIDIRLGSQISDDGRPCIVVDYAVRPRYEFDNLM